MALDALPVILLPALALGLIWGVLDYGMVLVDWWRTRARLRAACYLRGYLRGSGGTDSPGGRAALRARVLPGLVD